MTTARQSRWKRGERIGRVGVVSVFVLAVFAPTPIAALAGGGSTGGVESFTYLTHPTAPTYLCVGPGGSLMSPDVCVSPPDNPPQYTCDASVAPPYFASPGQQREGSEMEWDADGDIACDGPSTFNSSVDGQVTISGTIGGTFVSSARSLGCLHRDI